MINGYPITPKPCGSWLACDVDTSVIQANRVDAIAGKPGSHRVGIVWIIRVRPGDWAVRYGFG
ncbi:hypothetical protein EJ576_07815 [Pseudomonas sp. C 49-2]|nr:hypothetical protein EJ576_07815 [Pseudomonas sp. C 49-2]